LAAQYVNLNKNVQSAKMDFILMRMIILAKNVKKGVLSVVPKIFALIVKIYTIFKIKNVIYYVRLVTIQFFKGVLNVIQIINLIVKSVVMNTN
jgi:hypothetical protein